MYEIDSESDHAVVPAGRSTAPGKIMSIPGRICSGAYAAKLIDETQRFDITRNACPGAGACGGMYTANTMASAIEALGMSLPYSSSVPAEDPLKKMECRLAGRQVHLSLLLPLSLLLDCCCCCPRCCNCPF